MVELPDGRFGIPSSYAKRKGESYEPISIEQAQALAEAADGDISPCEFFNNRDHPFDNLMDVAEQVQKDWPEVEIGFGGDEMLGTDYPHAYLDAMYVFYEGVAPREHQFREDMVLRFKGRMNKGAEENEGICPFCDDRITLDSEMFRYPGSDENMYADPDEFDFYDDENGKYLRMWWDD